MANAFTLEAILAATRKLRGIGMLSEIHGGSDLPGAFESASVDLKPDPTRSLPPTIFGVRYVVNPAFPIEITCGACSGTGEGGDEATYCPKCDGAGAHRTEGMMRNGAETILMRSALPKRFAPHFPTDIPLPRRPASRARDIPWPKCIR